MSFYGDPYGYGGYGPPGYYPAYPAQYYSSGNTIYHHRRKPPKEKDNAQVWCDICDVGCIGQQSYIEHCSGRKHQLLERKRAQQSSSSPSSSSNPKDEPAGPNTTTTTSHTNINANINPNIDTNITSNTTSSNVRFSPYDPSSQHSKGQQGKFYCELCKIYSNDQSTFQLHLAGKKHKLNMQQLQPTVPDPYGPNLPSMSAMHMIHQPRYHLGRGGGHHLPVATTTTTLANTATNVEDDMLLTSKLAALTPSSSDALSLKILVDSVLKALENFMGTQPASTSDTSTPITAPVVVETKIVGPYAWGTLLKINLVADIVVITKEPPTFGILRYLREVFQEQLTSVNVELGQDTMDMHIRAPLGFAVHLLFTWIGAWDSNHGVRSKEHYPHDEYRHKGQDYGSASPSPSPSPSPPSSPYSVPSSLGQPHPAASLPWKPWTPPPAPPRPLSFSGHPVSPDTGSAKSSPDSSHALPLTDKPKMPSSSSSSPAESPSISSSPSETPARVQTPTKDSPDSISSSPPTTAIEPTSTTSTTLTSTTSTPTSTSTSTSPTLPPHFHTDPHDIDLLASQRALLMIKQAMWFSHNSLSPNVRQCIKIMKDLRHRHRAFATLNNWALEVMVVNALRTLPLSASISQSLRAIFAFIASGTLLPGVDLLDPCVPYGSVLQDISQEDRLAITKAAQKILNDIAFGRWEVIVG